jgi:hypothetical protein
MRSLLQASLMTSIVRTINNQLALALRQFLN